jgi:hypothetical protein
MSCAKTGVGFSESTARFAHLINASALSDARFHGGVKVGSVFRADAGAPMQIELLGRSGVEVRQGVRQSTTRDTVCPEAY